jgi:ATP-binding cassette, subfamily B, bacterial
VSEAIAKAIWPADRAGEAIEALARACGLPCRAVNVPRATNLPAGAALDRWIQGTAAWLGVEADATDAPYADVLELVRSSAPALVRSSGGGFLLLLGRGLRKVSLLDPERRIVRVDAEHVRAELCASLESTVAAEIDSVLDRAGLSGPRREKARRAILRRRLSHGRISDVWMLRLPPGAAPKAYAANARIAARLLAFAGAHGAQYLLWIASWWMLGAGALQGRVDRGSLIAWGLILATSIPARMIALWTGGLLAVDIGAMVKQRLLVGALRLAPEEVRTEGMGQHLARVIESEALEALALSGGLLALVATAELGLAAFVLAAGTGGATLLAMLAASALFALLLPLRYYEARKRWTDARLEMTHEMIEKMVGHRTRLAQERPERWHEGEDRALDDYVRHSRTMDRLLALLLAGPHRIWMVLAAIGIAPVVASGGELVISSLAIAVGGILLARSALMRISTGAASLAAAAIAWRRVKPLFEAASKERTPAMPDLGNTADESPVLLEASDLSFRYRSRTEPVLQAARFTIQRGDRILLEGSSGSGKSTLGALLAGLRSPDSGLLLLGGFDHHTLGVEGWRRRVVAAPQFHENHVITGTFAFNLLMGRAWPPSDDDLERATAICEELGLGPLLGRMPGGLGQMVGETGWQLSHGERSRLFLARALLQEAELVVLDESFAALDPETLERSLRCVLDRARTVVVIAHP